MVLSVWLKAGHTVELIRRSADSFTQRTGVEVDVRTVPEGEAHDALMSGTSRPDVVTVPYWYLPELVERDVLRPLDDLLAQESLVWEDFVAVAVRALSRDGARWAVPHTLTGALLSFRHDLFSEHGLAPPRTLNDVLHAARTLTRGQDVQHGLVTRASAEFSSFESFSGWAWARGVRLLPERGLPTADEFENGVGDLVRVLQATAPADLTLRDYAAVGDLVATGAAAQLFDTSAWGFFFEDPQASRVSQRVGYTTIEGPAAPAQFVYAEGLGVTSWSRMPREAAAFIAWRHSEASLREEVTALGRFDLPRDDLPTAGWYREAVSARGLEDYLSVVRRSWGQIDPAHLVSRSDFVPVSRLLMQVIAGVLDGRYGSFTEAMSAVLPEGDL